MRCGDPHALRAHMASPTVTFCIERERLAQEYSTAVLRHNRLHADRVVAVIKGLESPTATELIQAETEKEKAKIAVSAHQKEHGC